VTVAAEVAAEVADVAAAKREVFVGRDVRPSPTVRVAVAVVDCHPHDFLPDLVLIGGEIVPADEVEAICRLLMDKRNQHPMRPIATDRGSIGYQQ